MCHCIAFSCACCVDETDYTVTQSVVFDVPLDDVPEITKTILFTAHCDNNQEGEEEAELKLVVPEVDRYRISVVDPAIMEVVILGKTWYHYFDSSAVKQIAKQLQIASTSCQNLTLSCWKFCIP